MQMSWIDWAIVIFVIIIVTERALSTRKLTRSVADFLSANRCAGRYLLSIAQGEAACGAVSIIIGFEIFFQAGFSRGFWGALSIPVGLFITLSGWVIYRYRQTRALTMAQFFEMRYSRKFRVFAGILAWGSGILNFGIFPGVGARFFVNFCGFPPAIPVLGYMVSTYAIVMLILVSLALFYTFIGGQIAVLVTDFWQGMFATVVFVALVVFLWFAIPWCKNSEALIIASEPGKSLINPFDIASQPDFNLFFYVITIFLGVYGHMAWQGTSGYNSSALTPHEAKMSVVYGQLKSYMHMAGLMLLPLAVITLMHHPDFSDYAAKITSHLQATYPGNETLQTQMRTPTAISYFLPNGLIGAFAAIMLGFFISTNNTYMHSWGTIFVQDVVCPLRKKTFTNKQHLWMLKISIIGVAMFSYFFSLLYPMKEYIFMYFMITGAIYLGGAGAVIIGGLYWKRGTTAGAWAGMITGSSLSFLTIVLRQVWTKVPLLGQFSPEFPINGLVMAFYCALTAILVYVIVSLLTCKGKTTNMDKLLHRGKYAVKEEDRELQTKADHKQLGRLWRLIGVNSHEFSKVDRALFLYIFSYGIIEFAAFFVLCGMFAAGWMDNSKWLSWWKFRIIVFISIGAIGCAWISIGGLFDLKKMYRLLKMTTRDETDDGRVDEEGKQ